MPYTDFHYTPTGTGVISGKEVLEQTEDAINDLGTQISGDVQTAIDTANNALNVANTASSDAQNAVNTANTAYTTATNAQNTANTAQNTASNALTAAQNAQNDVNALGNRVTTAEGNITQNTTDITKLTTRMGTAENNITTLQNDVVTAQGTATSAQNTATMARQQAYVLRYSSTAITDNSTIAYSTLDNTDNIKVSDKIIDTDGKIFSIASVDSANETVTVGSALIDLALDANVMHLSGNETIAGIKTFSDDTFVKSLNLTKEITSQSSSSIVILPLVVNVTYTDQSPSQSAQINLRITADGSKSLYPNENGVYSLGLVSRNWDNVFSYMFEAFGKNIGNEFSNNARTNLYLKANRDTSGQSGVYVSKFRQNRAQGSMSGTDVVQVTFDVLENSVRSNRLWYLNWTDWENDIPKTVEVRSFCEKVDYKLTHINGINPGALSLPDTSNALDISGYITDLTGSVNTYTALADGYVSIRISGTAMRIAVSNGVESSSQRSSAGAVACYVPVVAGETVSVYAVGTSVNNAIFRPCKGNVY